MLPYEIAFVVLIILGCYFQPWIESGTPPVVLTWNDFGLCVAAIVTTVIIMLVIFPLLTLLLGAFTVIHDRQTEHDHDDEYLPSPNRRPVDGSVRMITRKDK